MPEALTLAVGEERRIAMPSRGSAGYSWDVHVTGDAISVGKVAGERPALPPPGGPPPPSFSLDELVIVTGTKPGQATIEAELARPGGAPVARRSFVVTVTP